MKNVIINFFKKNYFKIILKKFFKKFEKDNSFEAKNWAISNISQTIDQFCMSIDPNLFKETIDDTKSIEIFAKNELSKLNVTLGGGGSFGLLYFLIRKIKPMNVVETGVAAGWSSLAILRALKKNDKGFLYSSDFPYFRLKNPEQYIGYLARNEKNKENWYLDIRGDDIALPEIIKRLGKNNIDLIHYDSDKSYSGRVNAIKKLNSKISVNTIVIFDDIQDNIHFKDFVESNKKNFNVFEYQGKYIGVTGLDNFLI